MFIAPNYKDSANMEKKKKILFKMMRFKWTVESFAFRLEGLVRRSSRSLRKCMKTVKNSSHLESLALKEQKFSFRRNPVFFSVIKKVESEKVFFADQSLPYNLSNTF